jgi:hypothetical protein
MQTGIALMADSEYHREQARVFAELAASASDTKEVLTFRMLALEHGVRGQQSNDNGHEPGPGLDQPHPENGTE